MATVCAFENSGMSKEELAVTGQDSFFSRHIGPSTADTKSMLSFLGCSSLDELIAKVVPDKIRFKGTFDLGKYTTALSERDALLKLKDIVSKNKIYRSFIGCGYSNCITPPVILRNILENPGWYTQYTPYQAEISQGRLEALLNFQTMITDLTGLPVANASLLDEGTAAAEAFGLSFHLAVKDETDISKIRYLISDNCHPQTIALVQTRAEALGVKTVVGKSSDFVFESGVIGALVQYPGTHGEINDYSDLIDQAHQVGALVTMACDILALTALTSPGKLGADIAVGSAQRFGVPYGYGGPHAAYFATKDEYKRLMPGRLIGVSKDTAGRVALRLSLQTREQHIRREKATSNICTAQVLLAIMASMYAVYHGPEGIARIASRVNDLARKLAGGLKALGLKLYSESFFDTVTVQLSSSEASNILKRAVEKKINLRQVEQGLTIALDEATSEGDVLELLSIFGGDKAPKSLSAVKESAKPAKFLRSEKILTHPIFNTYHSETEFLRYVRRLESKDLSLGTAMIPLGSCTMKLNATTEMIPVTWPEVGQIHPFAPADQAAGYRELFTDLQQMLCSVTGFDAVSLQPNSGSQGEYAGLLAIRGLHLSRGNKERNICLIPKSAHGTNPASAAMAGMDVVVVACDARGNIDVADLNVKAELHKDKLSCLMATYPSTHGVFEEDIKECCEIIHRNGGQVYMDGANLNALVGLVRPADIGADVCHINLHKTFCIPHGGGGPGMGPIACRAHLAPFLPTHPIVDVGVKAKENIVGPVSAAPWGSASILVISWAYIAMMGACGAKAATEYAILNANYIAKKLEGNYPTLYRGKNGFVAHECILNCAEIKKNSGIEVEDIAKRLMDYGFHAPTVSFPVVGTLMVEPTESESLFELDRFCEAMNQISNEIKEIESGRMDRTNNPLKNAPHTALAVTSSEWTRPYTREQAAFPTKFTREHKFWPAVGRVDGNYGDRNFICTCPPMDSYE